MTRLRNLLVAAGGSTVETPDGVFVHAEAAELDAIIGVNPDLDKSRAVLKKQKKALKDQNDLYASRVSLPAVDVCTICLQIPMNPMKLPLTCSHIFCNFCILKWASTKILANEEPTCPPCRVQFDVDKLVRPTKKECEAIDAAWWRANPRGDA